MPKERVSTSSSIAGTLAYVTMEVDQALKLIEVFAGTPVLDVYLNGRSELTRGEILCILLGYSYIFKKAYDGADIDKDGIDGEYMNLMDSLFEKFKDKVPPQHLLNRLDALRKMHKILDWTVAQYESGSEAVDDLTRDLINKVKRDP